MEEIKVNDTMMRVTRAVRQMIELKKNDPDKYRQELETMRPFMYRMVLNQYGNLATGDELKQLTDDYVEKLWQDPAVLLTIYGMMLGVSGES